MVQWKMAPLETKVIFQAPMFHFHDYGRKDKIHWSFESQRPSKDTWAPKELPVQGCIVRLAPDGETCKVGTYQLAMGLLLL